jgi:hypothetical protein
VKMEERQRLADIVRHVGQAGPPPPPPEPPVPPSGGDDRPERPAPQAVGISLTTVDRMIRLDVGPTSVFLTPGQAYEVVHVLTVKAGQILDGQMVPAQGPPP